MGWPIAAGVLGILLMFGAYKWLTSWSLARAGAMSVPMIGTRPRRLAGVPEEAPADAKMPPGMVVLRHGGSALVVDVVEPAKSVKSPTPSKDAKKNNVAEEVIDVETVTAGSSSGVEIVMIQQGNEDSGEHVVIANTGPNPVALEGWRLVDEGEKNEYIFLGVILAPSSTIRIHMWRGEDSETDVYVGRRNRWWNNDGDTANLYDAAGVLVHSMPSGGAGE